MSPSEKIDEDTSYRNSSSTTFKYASHRFAIRIPFMWNVDDSLKELDYFFSQYLLFVMQCFILWKPTLVVLLFLNELKYFVLFDDIEKMKLILESLLTILINSFTLSIDWWWTNFNPWLQEYTSNASEYFFNLAWKPPYLLTQL